MHLRKLTDDESSDGGVSDKVFALRKQRNALIPLEGLPTELFLDIIREVVNQDASPSKNLMELITVSSWWRDVISDYSSLWGVIVYDCPSTYISLQLSRGALLDVKMPTCYARPRGHLKQFVEAVGPRAEQWRSLEFNGNEQQFQLLQPFLAGSLPHLKNLDLVVPGLPLLHALPTGSPLDRLFLQWTSLAPAVNPYNLKSLILGRIYGEDALTPSRILDIVEGCPDLQELQIWSLRPDGVENNLVQRHRKPIHLPNLRKLDLEDVEDQFAANLLRSIQAPGLTSSKVDVETSHAVRLLKAFLPEGSATPTISPLLILSKGANAIINVCAGNSVVHIILCSDPHKLDLNLRRLGPVPELGGVIAALSPYTSQASAVHLKLEGPLEAPSRLDLITNLTKLTIDSRDTAERIMTYLQSPEHCPRLEHIHSEMWWDSDVVAALMHARRPGVGGLKTVLGPFDM